MAMSKKGIFFTIIALSFISVMMYTFMVKEYYDLREDMYVTSSRIDTMNSFITDIEEDIQRSVYIAGFRALLGIQQHVTSTGEPIADLQHTFRELMLNGTINGSFTNFTQDSYFNEWQERAKTTAGSLGIVVSFENLSTSVYQESPWSVTVKLEAVMNVTDERGTATWLREQAVTSEIGITDFEDPLYTLRSDKKILNTIRQSPYTGFVDGSDTGNLTDHMEESYYISSDSGPSYLMRVQGMTGNATDGNGIESLIDIDQLAFFGFNTNKSVVDYIYWGGANVTSYELNHTTFRLDNESNHLSEYDAEALVIG